jgi:pilus assembly protein CpaF
MGTRGVAKPGTGADRWFQIKSQVHAKLLSSLTPDQLKAINKDSIRNQIAYVIERLVASESIPMTSAEKDRVIEEILDEVFGLGPLEQLLKDPTVSDILVNGFDNVYVERGGRLIETNIRFKDQAHLRMIIDRVVSNVGRRIDDSSPIVDARLADGSRVCAVIPPLSLIGPVVSIRRYGKKLLTTEDLVRNESLTTGMLDFLSGCVTARLNIVISGGSGSGKTTMLNTLSRFIPEEERIITIEDTAELQLQQDHVVRLETRPMNIEGAGAITQRDLLINTLRMRPDRIIVGESRGAEALDMLQAMNTGHDGSMTTVHANSPRDAFSRLETMVMMASAHVPDRVIRQQHRPAVRSFERWLAQSHRHC